MRVLFATDGSQYSKGAAQFLLKFNFSEDDEIIVLHALGWIPFKEDKESYHESFKQIKNKIGPKILDSTFSLLMPTKAKISTALLDGPPDEAIIDAAMSADADFIVMGARGLKTIASLIIGSVTRSVAINSSKPVLVVKPPQWKSTGPIRILFATDGSDYAETTGRFLAELPLPEDAEMRILTVARPLLFDIPESELTPDIYEKLKKATDIQVEESQKLIDHVQNYLDAPLGIIKVGDPYTEILEIADNMEADIIAVGSRGLRGVKGMMGSVSRSILGRANCSVLIGKTIE